jgi:hypothetical protein
MDESLDLKIDKKLEEIDRMLARNPNVLHPAP